MSDKRGKDSTPPPLLLMPAGGGLTLNPPDQPSMFMPVIQSEPSLLGSDEEGEADSFIGQTPPPSSRPNSEVPSQSPSTSNLFGQSVQSHDPFSQVGNNPLPPSMGSSNIAPPIAPPSFASPIQNVPSGPSGVTPPPAAKQSTGNAFRRQEGLRRPQYAQMPSGTYAGSGPSGTNAPPGLPDQQPGLFPGSQTPFPGSQPSFTGSQTAFPGQIPTQLPSSQPLTSIMSPLAGPPVAQVPPTVSMAMPQSLSGSPMPPKPQFGATSGPPGNTSQGMYTPVQAHWCYCKIVEKKEIWYPFSIVDSLQLEEAFRAGRDTTPVSTDGGRYDVLLYNRSRLPIYWDEAPSDVRRCTWFYKREGDNRYVPYSEEFSQQLEEEYKNAIFNNAWHKRLEFPGGETIVMHNTNVIVHFQPSSQPDEWGTVQGSSPMVGEGMRPRVVKRGVEDFESIDDGEPTQIDHLVFVVHGIGAFCDVKFRNIVECVDDFRSISLSLLKSHFKQQFDQRRIGRVEFLPVHWHSALHSDATGVDKRLKAITLPSTGKLRHFVNDTLMDILFYTSPLYCQTIADTVGNEMNRLYNLFITRNPRFQGTISVAGHSLGSSILFDLLMHQRDPNSREPEFTAPEPVLAEVTESHSSASQSTVAEEETDEPELTLEELLAKVGLQDKVNLFEQEQIDMESLSMCSEGDLKDLGLPMGPRKKLKGLLQEEQTKREGKKQQREQKRREDQERQLREKITEEMKSTSQTSEQPSPHVSASVSVEFLRGVAGTGQPIVKYPRLDFNPSALFAMGSPIGIFLSARGVDTIGDEFRLPTCPRVYNIFHPFDAVAYRLEPLVIPHASSIKPFLIPHYKGRKRLHLELRESLTRVGADIKQRIVDSLRSTWNSINQFAKAHRSDEDLEEQVDTQMSSVMKELDDDQSSVASSHGEDIHMGQLNEGRRIDYVLQERPIESFNDYLFALSSHGCYWESEDTVLLVLKELYSPYGINPQMPGPDSMSPQKLYNSASASYGPPPKAMSGPPPMQQFPSPGSSLGKQTSVPLMAPTSQNFGVPPVGIGAGSERQGPPYGGFPPSGPGMPPPHNSSAGPPPLTGFVKGVQQ